MPIDLRSYTSIQSNLFVKIEIDEYRTTAGGAYTSEILRFTDRNTTATVDGYSSWLGLGNFLSISNTSSEIRATEQEVSIAISGIPNSSIDEIIYSKIKGSKVTIFRGLYDNSGTLLSIAGNPMMRFSGYVNNYSLTEDWDSESRTSSNTLLLLCNSNVDVLSRKISGRRTNPASEKKYFPNDVSMDRVPTLADEYFDFGKKR